MRHFRTAASTLVCFTIVSGLGFFSVALAKDSDTDHKKSELPACLSKLKLTDDQKSKATEIVQKYDAKIDKAMKHFSQKYLETVETEAALLTSVEDALSEQQRESIRSQRRKAAQSDKDLDHDSSKSQDNSKPGQTNSAPQKKPTVVVEEIDEIVFDNGITLTIEQEAIADRITNRHLAHLRALHRRIHSIHNRLIALETDKLVELEKLLTKEQLSQLREERLTTASDSKVTTTSSDAPSKD